MKKREVIHDDWATPPKFYRELDKRFGFDFDPCPWRHKFEDWDGLEREWGEMNFVNPPYSSKLKKAFIEKAIFERDFYGRKSVFLIPVSTSTVLFHDIIKPNMIAPIEFVRGRLRFIGVNLKGQKCNFDQIMPVDTEELIEWYDPKKQKIVRIPKHIRASGQHDSMLIQF